jgi:hypothetical protein
MKPYRNRGWRWLRYMENILPVAGATGARSYAPNEADPPPLVDQDDQNSDRAISHPLTHNLEDMDLDSATTIISADILQPPATKRQRLSDDGASSSPSLSIPDKGLGFRTAERSRKSEKGKGKAKTSSDHSEFSAANRDLRSSQATTSFTGRAQAPGPSTSQRVNKITPAAALVELHGSVDGMTKAILAAAKPPASVEDKAVVRCQEAVRLVQERDDGLSLIEKANLIVFFGSHITEADMYIALQDSQLRREVIKHWIQVQDL